MDGIKIENEALDLLNLTIKQKASLISETAYMKNIFKMFSENRIKIETKLKENVRSLFSVETLYKTTVQALGLLVSLS